VLGIDSERRFPAKRFSRSSIERERYGIEVVLRVDRQVRALGNVLPQQAIGIFIETTLPRAVGGGKVNLHTGTLGQNFVGMHFAALVVGHRFAHSRRLAVEHGREALDHRTGAGVLHLGQHHEAGSSLDQCADRGTIAFALNQVALPMARDETVLDLGRTDVDALHLLDLASAVNASTARLAHLVMMAQAGNQFALQFSTRMQIDRVVDRLVRDLFSESSGHMARSMFAICCGDQSAFR
jgi:hypothetical protein